MIRKAMVDDIRGLADLAAEFYASSEFLTGFDLERFVANWTAFITGNIGAIFILEENGEKIGALGAAKYPDFNSGEMIATEFFWFVSETKRGGGLRLLRAFEEWAKDEGCTKVMMVHLMDSMPEKLKRVYEAFQYKAAEIHYVKEVV